MTDINQLVINNSTVGSSVKQLSGCEALHSGPSGRVSMHCEHVLRQVPSPHAGLAS